MLVCLLEKERRGNTSHWFVNLCLINLPSMLSLNKGTPFSPLSPQCSGMSHAVQLDEVMSLPLETFQAILGKGWDERCACNAGFTRNKPHH